MSTTTREEPLGYSRVSVSNGPGRAKLVTLPLREEPVAMGMRDEVADHYGLTDADYEPETTTIDYFVGSVAGCLAGTLGGRLAAIGQDVNGGALKTEATGELVVTNGVVRVRAIDVQYTVTPTEGVDRAKIERAHRNHHRYCPVATSVGESIDITTHLTIDDAQ